MAVEIGSLVVRGTFGTAPGGDVKEEQLHSALTKLRRDMLEEVRDMIAEADRRRGGR